MIKNNVNHVIFYLLPLIILSFIGCVPPAKIHANVTMPAKFHEATLVREIAVLPFDGPHGKEFASEIEETLATVIISDKPYYKLIDRMAIDKTISELKLSQSGLVEPENAAKIGKLLGAKGIYTGVITTLSISDTPYTENRTRCGQYTTTYYPYGKSTIPITTCAVWEPYPVNCTKRVANFTFVPKLIEVETGRVLYSNSISGSSWHSACIDKGAVTDKSTLLINAKNYTKQVFRKDVAPYQVAVDIEVDESTDGITSGDSKKKFESGLEFAKGNRLDRACDLWKESSIKSPNAIPILYNLGICYEVSGELEQALIYYKKADSQLSKPENRISAAINRVVNAISRQKKLMEQQK
ncbi:MAG: hypothetical protein LLF28_02305 [Nitrospiraceae bacterium]|nr:hypothetical protein [Nitrospiraceae bacterium]